MSKKKRYSMIFYLSENTWSMSGIPCPNCVDESNLLLLYNKVQISSIYPQFASSDSIRCKRLWRYATLFCNSCFR